MEASPVAGANIPGMATGEGKFGGVYGAGMIVGGESEMGLFLW